MGIQGLLALPCERLVSICIVFVMNEYIELCNIWFRCGELSGACRIRSNNIVVAHFIPLVVYVINIQANCLSILKQPGSPFVARPLRLLAIYEPAFIKCKDHISLQFCDFSTRDMSQYDSFTPLLRISRCHQENLTLHVNGTEDSIIENLVF